MGSETCQQITAVERYGVVVLRNYGLCLSHVSSFCRARAHSKHWPSSLFKFSSFIRWQSGQFPGIFLFAKGFILLGTDSFNDFYFWVSSLSDSLFKGSKVIDI